VVVTITIQFQYTPDGKGGATKRRREENKMVVTKNPISPI